MINYREILNQISYLYYPKDMYEFDVSFLETTQTKNLLHRISSANTEEYDSLTKDIDSIYKNASNFEMGRNFPSYIIQIDLDSTENCKHVVVVYLSYLIPFYSVVVLKGNYQDNSITIDLDREQKEKKLIDSLKSLINRQLKYHEFERDIIKEKIPQIKLSEDFSYFNAFFADVHRINNF